MNGIKRILLSALGLLALPLAAQGPAVLGSSGEVYMVQAGSFGKLFPGVPGVDAGYPVLALDLVNPGVPVKRILVPDTQGIEVDTLSSILFEETSDTLFLAWESREVYPVLMLAGFDGTSWSEPVSVIGNPWAVKTSPRISITHDSYRFSGETEEHDRSILHMIWGEEDGNGNYKTFYSPVIFEKGAFSGKQPPIFNLDAFDRSDDSKANLPAELIPVSQVVPGKHGQTLIVAFTSPRTHRLLNLEIEVLPSQLGRISDEARMHIIEIGNKYSYPAGYKMVADFARMHIIEIGVRGFQAEVAKAMGDDVYKLIFENKGLDKLEAIAERARMHIIEIGARLSDRGLVTAASSSTAQIQQIASQGSLSLTGPDRPAASPHLLTFRMAGTWPAPEIGQGPVRYFPAKSGNGLLVSWAEKDLVKYRETQGADWSSVREIALSKTVDLNRAYEILEAKMSRH